MPLFHYCDPRKKKTLPMVTSRPEHLLSTLGAGSDLGLEVGGGVWMSSVGSTAPPLQSDPGGFPRSQDGGCEEVRHRKGLGLGKLFWEIGRAHV